MQILGPAVARRRALSWHFNGVINPRGQVPAHITPVWYLHYLAHGVTQVTEISSGGVTRSQISFSVQHGDWKKVLLAVPWYVPRTWTKWSFLPIFSNRLIIKKNPTGGTGPGLNGRNGIHSGTSCSDLSWFPSKCRDKRTFHSQEEHLSSWSINDDDINITWRNRTFDLDHNSTT